MSRKLVTRLIIIFLITGPYLAKGNDDTDVCPGRGERCAYVKILGIKIWQKKAKGGPGIIIKPVSE
jgi:hypothetical protein